MKIVLESSKFQTKKTSIRQALEFPQHPILLHFQNVYLQIIPNITRKYHDGMVKCEVHNAVGKSEESEVLDISC